MWKYGCNQLGVNRSSVGYPKYNATLGDDCILTQIIHQWNLVVVKSLLDRIAIWQGTDDPTHRHSKISDIFDVIEKSHPFENYSWKAFHHKTYPGASLEVWRSSGKHMYIRGR